MSGSTSWLAPDPQQRRQMYARILMGQQPQSSGWGNAGAPAPLPVMTAPSQGAAVAQTGQDFLDWRAKARAANVAAGLLDPDTGLPTQRGWQEAGRNIATGMGPSDIGVPGGMIGAIKAYHGSPYSFERFDLGKIGTGEGAQAFGHGLYFAESPGVARSYREALADPRFDGQPYNPDDPLHRAAFHLNRNGGDQSAALAALDRDDAEMALKIANLQQMYPGVTDQNLLQGIAKPYGNARIQIAQTRSVMTDPSVKLPEVTEGGHMYEVNINADPEHFLHWDNPRDQLAPNVQEWAKENYPAAWDKAADGASLYQHIVKQVQSEYPGATKGYLPPPGFNAPAQVAQEMARAGIPGIRYLDQNSRYTSGAEHVGTVQGPDGTWRATLRSIGQPDPALPNTAPESVLTKSPPMQTKEAADAWAADKTSGATHNIVAFDPATIDIIRKYGIAGLMAGGAAAAAPSLAGAGNGTNQGGGS